MDIANYRLAEIGNRLRQDVLDCAGSQHSRKDRLFLLSLVEIYRAFINTQICIKDMTTRIDSLLEDTYGPI